MTHKQFADWLEKRNACEDGVAWVRRHKHTPESAWEACVIGTQMLWGVWKAGPSPTQARGAVKVARRCAERAQLAASRWTKTRPMYLQERVTLAAEAAQIAAEAAEAKPLPGASFVAQLAYEAAEAAEDANLGREELEAEYLACAQDCRELIPAPVLAREGENHDDA